ncbi:MAG: hypothetical protein AAGI01_18845 [Myxococcota bacterium]
MTSPSAEAARDIAAQAQDALVRAAEDNPATRLYRDNPYVLLAAAAGLGYIAAGGLFTPFSRRVIKMGMRALIIPVAVSQIRSATLKSLNDI